MPIFAPAIDGSGLGHPVTERGAARPAESELRY